MKARGKKSSEAELLFRKWLESQGWLVDRAAKAGLKRITKSDGSPVFRRDGKPMVVNESHDRFACFDTIAVRPEQTWACQVTTQSGRTARRRKIEALAAHWPIDWRISLVSHEATEDPAHRGRQRHFWRIEDFTPPAPGSRLTMRTWSEPYAVEFSVSAGPRAARGCRLLAGGDRTRPARDAPAEAPMRAPDHEPRGRPRGEQGVRRVRARARDSAALLSGSREEKGKVGA